MISGSDGGGERLAQRRGLVVDDLQLADRRALSRDHRYPRFPYRVYGAQQDNTTVSLPSAATDGAIMYSDFYDVGGSESGCIAVRPNNPNIVYGGIYEGMLTRYDHATGENRDITVWPENPAGWGRAA